MSKENVELARRYVEAFNTHGLEAAKELWHPEIELWDPPDLPDADRHAGRSAFQEQVEGYLALGWDGQFRAPDTSMRMRRSSSYGRERASARKGFRLRQPWRRCSSSTTGRSAESGNT